MQVTEADNEEIPVTAQTRFPNSESETTVVAWRASPLLEWRPPAMWDAEAGLAGLTSNDDLQRFVVKFSAPAVTNPCLVPPEPQTTIIAPCSCYANNARYERRSTSSQLLPKQLSCCTAAECCKRRGRLRPLQPPFRLLLLSATTMYATDRA